MRSFFKDDFFQATKAYFTRASVKRIGEAYRRWERQSPHEIIQTLLSLLLLMLHKSVPWHLLSPQCLRQSLAPFILGIFIGSFYIPYPVLSVSQSPYDTSIEVDLFASNKLSFVLWLGLVLKVRVYQWERYICLITHENWCFMKDHLSLCNAPYILHESPKFSRILSLQNLLYWIN